ncbi:MAG: isoleucine--tRNA ligase [Candidatus Marinimicrobia bacterium]|nr:isoleucine--tRNA ligase [Candidatus Neomarinimicrobiota bacterium]
MIKKVPANVDFIALEHEMLDFWEKNQIFRKLIEKNANSPKWSFIDGPITANNPMGVHHAWGRTYKDVFQRYKAMNGYRTRYQNGFDCQGLWVEVEVEKELGFKSKTDIEEYGIEKFVNKCKERVVKYSKIQSEQSIRLGYWMDWNNSYYTMSDENNYTIWLFLKKCHENGWIYKGHDVMPWCARCGAALSEHEIATEGYREITHTSITVRFPIDGRENEYLLIWTTTPWTLTANTAAAVHPDKSYLKVKQGNDIYYLIDGRQDEVISSDYTILEKVNGQDMLGWTYRGPFDELTVQKDIKHVVIAWEEISETEGTGIVHIAPGCGQEDHELGIENDLSVIAPLDEFGNYIEGFDWLTGRNVNDVNKDIFRNLEAKGFKYRLEAYTHRYPICWRHGTELVFRLVDEWFISMDGIRQAMMDVTRKIRWIPEYGLQHELDWLKNMHDWMISKKRYWGLALPIYECKSCGNLTVLGSKEELKERAVEGWEEFEGNSPHRPWVDAVKIKCDKCGAKVSRVEDVGNPWLDAGIVPYSTLHYTTDHDYWEEWFPAEFICESLPGQFRNWFYSLLAMSTVLENREPFKVILGHALVKDEKGQEMHKSAGNAIWFDEAAEKMGVDVMRWLYVDHNPVNNLNFGYKIAKDFRKQMITLWNSYSFFATYAALDSYSPETHKVASDRLSELDRWLLARLNLLIKQIRAEFDNYAPGKAMKFVDEFLEVLSNWYIRRSRRRFWKSEDDSDKWSAYQSLYTTLKNLIRIIAPVIPFLTDAIYQNLVRALEPDAPISVHLTSYPICDEKFIDETLLQKIDSVIKIVGMGRAARNKANLKVRQPLQMVYVKLPTDIESAAMSDLQDQILEELNIKEIEFIQNDNALAGYVVKPNFARLGVKYGKSLGEIRTALASVSASDIARKIEKGETVELQLTDNKVFLESEDLLIERRDAEGLAVVFDGDYTVAIDTELTDDLKYEGYVRDLVRHVQTMRKDADFKVEDRIRVYIEAAGPVKTALNDFIDYFKRETLSVEIEFTFQTGEIEKELIIDGNKVRVSIRRNK